MLRDDVDQDNIYNNQNWTFHIKSLLDRLGFANVWREQDHLPGILLPQVRQSLLDQYNQSIISSMNDSHKLTLYRRYKTEIKSEQYLDYISANKYKIALSRFRLSSHIIFSSK